MWRVTLGLCPWEAFYHENAGTRPSYARARGVPVAPKGNALLETLSWPFVPSIFSARFLGICAARENASRAFFSLPCHLQSTPRGTVGESPQTSGGGTIGLRRSRASLFRTKPSEIRSRASVFTLAAYPARAALTPRPSATRAPRSGATLVQYSTTRSCTSVVTPALAWATMLVTRWSRSVSFITSR